MISRGTGRHKHEKKKSQQNKAGRLGRQRMGEKGIQSCLTATFWNAGGGWLFFSCLARLRLARRLFMLTLGTG